MNEGNNTKSKEIKRLYDETAYLYNLRYAEIQEQKYSMIANDLLTRISSLKKRTFLVDIGCGTGIFFEFLFDKLRLNGRVENNLLKYIGADISPNMIKKTLSLQPQKYFYDRLLLNAEFLPFSSHFFKFVFSFTVLQNVSNRLSALDNLLKLLALNGFAAISILKKVFVSDFLKQSLTTLYGISFRIQKISKKSCEDVILTTST